MNIRFYVSFTIIITSFISNFANAASFEEYIKRLNKHPQVDLILAESEVLKMESEGELGLPDPVLMAGSTNMPISDSGLDRFKPMSNVYGVFQAIPNPATRKAKSEKLDQSSKKQKLIASFTKERLKFILIAKMAEYQNLKTQVKILNQQLEYYKMLDITFKGQIESGRSVYKRFSEVDVERASAERKLNNINAGIIAIKADFISLIGEVPEIKIPKLINKQWNQDPNILYPVMISAQNILISKKGVKVAETAFYPNFAVNSFYKKSDDNVNEGLTIQAHMSVPLWASKNQEPKRRAAEAEESSAKFAHNDSKRTWTQTIIALQSMRDSSASNIIVLQEQDKAMKAKIDALQRNYEAGSEELDNILLAKVDRLNTQSQLSQVEAMHIIKTADCNSIISKNEQEIIK
jgi:outer membrane protein, heavy metal efflux system